MSIFRRWYTTMGFLIALIEHANLTLLGITDIQSSTF